MEDVIVSLIAIFCIICTLSFVFIVFIFVSDEKNCEKEHNVYDCERVIIWQPVKE